MMMKRKRFSEKVKLAVRFFNLFIQKWLQKTLKLRHQKMLKEDICAILTEMVSVKNVNIILIVEKCRLNAVNTQEIH